MNYEHVLLRKDGSVVIASSEPPLYGQVNFEIEPLARQAEYCTSLRLFGLVYFAIKNVFNDE